MSTTGFDDQFTDFVPEGRPFTGNAPGMLQDDDRGLSGWLSRRGPALQLADEAAAAISAVATGADHLALLREAATLFRSYEQSHRARGPEHLQKAERNAEIASRIEAALIAQPAQAPAGEPVALDVTLTDDEAKLLRDMLGTEDDPATIRLIVGQGHSGHGLYAVEADYQSEGSVMLHPIATPPAAARVPLPTARSLTDELMDCVDRLGSEFDAVDPRVWDHLRVYMPTAARVPLTDAQIDAIADALDAEKMPRGTRDRWGRWRDRQLARRAIQAASQEGAPPAAARVPDAVIAALDEVDDFIARANGDDRGSCGSVNVLREFLASLRGAA